MDAANFRQGYIGDKYVVEPFEGKPRTPSGWSLEAAVLKIEDQQKTKIGSFLLSTRRNPPIFFPFTSPGMELALYSEGDSELKVMDLSNGRCLGTEARDESIKGYVKTIEVLVPHYRSYQSVINGAIGESTSWLVGSECFNPGYMKYDCKVGSIKYMDMGFVNGDSGMDDELYFLDLSRAHEGVIRRHQDYGSFFIRRPMKLKRVLDFREVWDPHSKAFGVLNHVVVRPSTIKPKN